MACSTLCARAHMHTHAHTNRKRERHTHTQMYELTTDETTQKMLELWFQQARMLSASTPYGIYWSNMGLSRMLYDVEKHPRLSLECYDVEKHPWFFLECYDVEEHPWICLESKMLRNIHG